MSRRTLAALLLAASSLAASSASAWEPIYSSRPVWRSVVPYSLHSAGSSDLGGFAGTAAEVQRGMDDWTRVSCTSLRSSYLGATSAIPGTYEGTSVIGWIESGWRHDSSAIGVTGPQWSTGIIEADMEMNGQNFNWTTGSGSYSSVNAYSIILHEGGHYYGLGHTTVRGSSMWPSYGGGIIGLGADDQTGICALYPGGGTDCTTTGCPSGQECVSGTCTTIAGGTVCSPCSDSSQCGGGGALCLGYPDGGGYCGRSCSSDADCGADSCVGTSAGPQCVRYVGDTATCAGAPSGCTRDSDCGADRICSGGDCVAAPPTGNELGAGCSGDEQCRSRLCMGGVCSQSCDWLDARSCPGGFYCDGDVSPSCTSGYCLRGAAGAGAIGDPCSGDTECTSMFCNRGMCSQPCIPEGAVGCPSGYSCQVDTLPCRGACRRARALGDACDGNPQCATAACASRGGDTFCTQECDSARPCPEGFTCMGAGGTSVCAPDRGGLDWECQSDAACLSGICTQEGGATYCTRSCGGPSDCPEGFACGTSDLDAGVCVREQHGLGQDCAGNADCASGICATAGSDTFCTRACSADAPCPSEFECVAVGESSICRPGAAPPSSGPGCGCRAAGSPGAPLVPALIGIVLALLVRRRR